MSVIVLIKGVEAMCSSCGHPIVWYGRWTPTWTGIAHDQCLCPADENEINPNEIGVEKCYCSKHIPEPDTENYHHCRVPDLKAAGFKDAEEIVKITDVEELLRMIK